MRRVSRHDIDYSRKPSPPLCGEGLGRVRNTEMDGILYAVTLFAAIGSGIITGAFFAFSTFVMKALGRQPAPAGIAAMNEINVTVINPFFMLAFAGTAAVGVGLAVVAVLELHEDYAPYLLAASLFYVVGCFLQTMALNVPLNDELAKADPQTDAAARLWSRYLTVWTAWNSFRTVAAGIAMALFTVALSQ
jgi:uncharacterized membrane protein